MSRIRPGVWLGIEFVVVLFVMLFMQRLGGGIDYCVKLCSSSDCLVRCLPIRIYQQPHLPGEPYPAFLDDLSPCFVMLKW